MRTLLLTVTAAALLLLGTAAHASVVYDFSYVDDATGGSQVTASGVLTTDGLDDGGGLTQVLNITGLRNGVAITGLSDFAGGDNYILQDALAPFVDGNGLSFSTADGNDYNLWATYTTDGTGISEYGTDGGAGYVDFTLTAVPEPASIFLVAAGLLGLTLTTRRARRG